MKLRGSREGIRQCFFSLLIQTSFCEGKNTGWQAANWGGGEHLCGCAPWERITYVYAFVQMWMYLCYSCLFCVPLSSEWGERLLDFWNTVLKHCKQARALLTMSLRVNAQNNFQLKIRFSGKSEFHAYYCRINADPRSTSTRRRNFWQQLQTLFQTWNTAQVHRGKRISITCHCRENTHTGGHLSYLLYCQNTPDILQTH